MALDSIDMTLGAGTTGLTAIGLTSPDPNTNIIALAVQVVGVISLLLKHRAERKQRRKQRQSSTNN